MAGLDIDMCFHPEIKIDLGICWFLPLYLPLYLPLGPMQQAPL